MSPTQRTLAYLRRQGWCVVAEVVQRWLPLGDARSARRGYRRDLFRCIDVLAICYDGASRHVLLGIQCCAAAAHVAHERKVQEQPFIRGITATIPVEVWSWRRAKPRGCRPRWVLRRSGLRVENDRRYWLPLEEEARGNAEHPEAGAAASAATVSG